METDPHLGKSAWDIAVEQNEKRHEAERRDPAESGSQQAVDGRRGDACEQERWRVDEWCERREGWWVLDHHNTYARAADQLDYLSKKCPAPKRRWRVVWIRERVQLLSAESPIAKLKDAEPLSGGNETGSKL